MISNCKGCEEEFKLIEEYSELGLHFAGEGLYKKGHLLMKMVNDKGRVIVE